MGTPETWLSAGGMLLGIATIVLAIVIARRQDRLLREHQKQLKQLEAIERDTGSTARKLNADAIRQDFVRDFLAFDEQPSRIYRCVVPVRYEQRPLPLIPAGDYNALHVFQSLMGPDLLFSPVPNRQDTIQEASGEPQRGDAIYLCSPNANSELDKLAPAIDLADDRSVDVPKFDGVDLPCWFANDSRASEHGGRVPGEPTMKLWICEPQSALPSDAERAYREAKGLPDGVPVGSLPDTQSDSAIVLRLTDSTRGRSKAVVVAGIHQYGTWIAGEFFCRLSKDPGLEYRDIFVADDDFIAIIWGEFNSKTFAVDTCGVQKRYLWTRQDGGWTRVPQRASAPALTM